MNFFKAFYITGATSVLVTIIAFFNNVIVTRYLGPSGRGQYSIAVNIILILSLILGEGIRRSNILIVGKNKNSAHLLIKKTFFYFLGLILLGIILIIIVNKNFITLSLDVAPQLINIAILATAFIILWRSLQSIYLGLQDYKRYNQAQLFYTALIFLINILIIYLFHLPLLFVISNFVLVSFIISIYEFYGLKNYFNQGKVSIIKEDNHLVIRATITSISSFILLKGDIFIVNHFLGAHETGIYSISLVIVDIFQKLPLVLGPIIIARSANYGAKQEVENIAKLTRVLVATNILFVLLTLVIGRMVIMFVFSNQFEQSYYLLLYILPALVIFSSGHIINAFLMGQGFPNFVILNNLFFAIFDILLNYILIPIIGIKAAAINCSISYILWSISFFIYFKVKYGISFRDILFVKFSDIKFIYNKVLG